MEIPLTLTNLEFRK